MARTIGVIDEPVAPGATDNLDITIHSRSLIKFIQQTNKEQGYITMNQYYYIQIKIKGKI